MFSKELGVHIRKLGLQDEVRRMIMAHKDVKTTINACSDYTIRNIVRGLLGFSLHHSSRLTFQGYPKRIRTGSGFD